MMSPFESPISPCSSIPCRSSAHSHSICHSTSLTRGRSPPSRTSSDINSVPSLTPSRLSSSSPSRIAVVAHRPRPHAASPPSHRPTPIVTSGIQDVSLSLRLSHLRSPDLAGSVSSLAYSDMDASPAVNFLSAFADATLPSSRTEISPVTTTVPSLVIDEGDKVADYIFGSIIGRGGFSVVREAHHAINHQKVAVKIVKRSCPSASGSNSSSTLPKRISPQPMSLHASINTRDRSSSVNHTINRHLVNSAHLPLPTSATEDLASALLKQEIQIWSSLRPHPNIVPLLSLHETPTQTLLFMPICEGGNLLQLLNQVKLDPSSQDHLYQVFNLASITNTIPLPSHQLGSSLKTSGLRLDLVQQIFSQIVEGLRYLHTEAGIVHKDIKLENILIQNGQIKISDFGLATYPFSERPSNTMRNTKGKASSSWNRDLSLPKNFSALPRITEGRITGIDTRAMSWSQSHRSRSRLPPMVDNSQFSSQPVREDDDDDDVVGYNQINQSLSSLSMVPTAAGSLAYTPPEQLRSEVPLACPSLDIWALGCVLYGLLDGHLPFEDDFEPRLRLKIMNGQYSLPQSLSINPEEMSEAEVDNRMMISKVLKGCLAVDRNARWMIQEIATSVWLGPSFVGLSHDTSDDGQSFEDVLDQLSSSKRSYSVTSSLPSVWSFDEPSLNPSIRMSSPPALCQEDDLCLAPQGSTSPLPFRLSEPHPSSPLTRKDLSDLRKLLSSTTSHSPPSRISSSMSQRNNSCCHAPIESPTSPGIERVARPKNRSGCERHHPHGRMSVPKAHPGSPRVSNSRSRSRNRN